jgi:chaperonin GroEL
MEFNLPSQIVKDLNFGDDARNKIMSGVYKLSNAVKSTLGASGKCVIYEDGMGRPVITKDGVTVAESVVLIDPVENIGATLIKEAASNTVKQAGDGTTTAIVLAQSLLNKLNEYDGEESIRDIKEGVTDCAKEIMDYLDTTSIEVQGEMLSNVAYISCNNDEELGDKIGEAYEKVGKNGVVLMEDSPTNETYVEFVEGTQFASPVRSPHLITDKEKGTAVLDNPYVLIVGSAIPNVRRIQNILEHVVKTKRSLLIVASVDQQPYATLLANKVKGNIKVNIVDLPGFGPTKEDAIEDLAILTGAKAVTDAKNTTLQINEITEPVAERIKDVERKIKKEKNGWIKKKLEERLTMLTGKVAVLFIGADSEVELKEKKDRVDDALHATKAALAEGIVAGGGVALLNASQIIESKSAGYDILLAAITSPYHTILENAGYADIMDPKEYVEGNKDIEDKGWEGVGVDATCGCYKNMVDSGIVDPVLVTKTALKNAISVATTIVSADCIISNVRSLESN